MEFDNSVVLITGASRGLGFEVAQLLARRRAKLIIVGRDAAALETAAAELRKHSDIYAYAGDVSEHAEDIVALGVARFGRIGILINNASELGPSPMPALDSLDWQAFERILRVNVVAPLHLIQLVLPHMRRHGGTIVNISSDAGVAAYPGWGGYGASKAALEHLSRTLAAEVAGDPVRVLVVDPGDMNTEMHRLAEPGIDLSHLPAPSLVAPSIVALVENPASVGRYQAQEQQLEYAAG